MTSSTPSSQPRLQWLQQITGALSGMLSAREAAAVVATQGREALGADAVAVFLCDGDELEIAGYEGYSGDDFVPFCRVPRARSLPSVDVINSREPLFLTAEEARERYPDAKWGRLAGEGLLVSVPLIADDRVLGSLGIRMPPGAALEGEDRVLLDVLAHACAQALLRADHVNAERSARRAAEEANALLNTVLTTAPEGFALLDTELRYVRVNQALAAMNGVAVADHIGRSVHEVAPEAGHAPLQQVLETGEAVLDLEISGRTPADPEREHTWLVNYYPLFGADGEIEWLGAFVVDITARKRAEERSALLAELGAILDEVVSVEARLARLVDALVPRLGDMLSVLLREPDGSLERIAVRHVDRALEVEMVALDKPDPEHLLGGTTVVDDLDAVHDIAGADPTARRDLGARSYLLVPMVVRGRRIGLLAFGALTPGAFGPDEVAFAEEVARRAATAVENARLYEGERAARERTAHLHRVAMALSEALTAVDVANAILNEVLPAIGAVQGTVWQLDDEESALVAVAWRGVEDAVLESLGAVPLLEHWPVTDAVNRRETIWLTGPRAQMAAYPRLADEMQLIGSRASATVPLLSGGRAVGAMTISFSKPRRFENDDRALVAALAAQCAQALERARLYETERKVSVTLQRALLPARLPEVEGVRLAVQYLPARGLEAGGDFYEALPLGDGVLGIAVGDVVGRGATAAAAMGQLRSALRAFALTDQSPSSVLARLSSFATTVSGATASTALFATLDTRSGELCWARAGHPWPLLVRADGRAEYLRDADGVPLGVVADAQFEQESATLEPGSTLLLYTDGLMERRTEDITIAFERLRTVASKHHQQELEQLLEQVVVEVGDAAPMDDVALVAVRLEPVVSRHVQLRYPAERGQVPIARAAVRGWLAGLGVPSATAGDVLLAAGEAFANAVEHAYRGGAAGDIEVELELADRSLVSVTVSDHGSWKKPEETPYRGRGLKLMNAVMESVDVAGAEGGTRVTMTQRLQEGPPLVLNGSPRGKCSVAFEGGVARLTGELDMAAAPGVEEALVAAGNGAGLTVDLAGVTYLDSAGARVLVSVRERLGGRLLVIAPPQTAPRRALELSGLAAVLELQ